MLLFFFGVVGFVTCEVLVADEKPDTLTIATWNLEWFYDDDTSDNESDVALELSSPSRAEWEWKKQQVAAVIAEIKPTILCLQEVENRRVLYRLRQELEQNHGLRYRYAFIGGYDFGTEQDVGILYRSGLVEYSRREQSQEMFDSQQYYNLSKHIIARFEWGTGEERESLVILNSHLRARAEKADLRQRQCRLIRHWMQDAIRRGENVIVTGDFNTEEDFGKETRQGAVSIVRGLVTESPEDDLQDANERLAEDQRSTHLSGRQYDRVFYSRPLGEDDPERSDLVLQDVRMRRDLVVRGDVDVDHWDSYYKIPQAERDLSDHYPLVVEFDFR
ncbi:MAG: endonuclease/exonuclease/phosphatase family protein [Pirellulaceae bacterium]